MTTSKLEMTFDPCTIEHLGIRMYSTLPPVIAELVANAYDADATEVAIQLNDRGEKTITVADNGIGMSFDDINNNFLRIGRNRRSADSGVTQRGRKVIGKKGLGKLSFFGISKDVIVSTVQDGIETSFSMNLDDILGQDHGSYSPPLIVQDKRVIKTSGTTIVLKNIERQSNFSADQLARSLSRMFIIDNDFVISVSHNDEKPVFVTRELRYSGINVEFRWDVPIDADDSMTEYFKRHGLTGTIVTSEKPLPPGMRGIALYSRGKLVNVSDSFVDGDSSHFFSYMAGFLDVSFVDDLEYEAISTNRQSLIWNTPDTQELRENLGKLVRYLERSWREKRREKNRAKVRDDSKIDLKSWVETNSGEEREAIQTIVNGIVDAPETQSNEARVMLEAVHDLVPEYARYHWRFLHEEVQSASRGYYQQANYYTAVCEAVKRYVACVRAKSSISQGIDELNLLQKVFAKNNPILKIALGYVKSDSTSFSEKTLANIEDGNRGFAVAVWQGVRNPISHEEIGELRESGLFSEADCLDALSILSYLFRRLDNAKPADSSVEVSGDD